MQLFLILDKPDTIFLDLIAAIKIFKIAEYTFFYHGLDFLSTTALRLQSKRFIIAGKNMNAPKDINTAPQILAPAGNRAAFLAALAAGADAVYCGLKRFSARMEAKNFSIEELAALTALAHEKGTRVFVTLNTLLKPDELTATGQLLEMLERSVKPDAVIIQDLAMVALVKQTGFSGQVHLSTLANASFAGALQVVGRSLGVDRVVLPRELNVDELRSLSAACPPGLELEVFIHGALCYAVSGRCYWSSYLGGKSGLRGRCVQPCRRLYRQNNRAQRYFSCQDLSVDVLAKVLLSIPRVRTWKIEGRKKGPHYVYYTVSGYRLLRDHGGDPQMKKSALQLLAQALGRSGTHYFFLPQRPQNPVDISRQTGSGLPVGRIKGSRQNPYFIARQELLPGDVLRIGYEDEAGHTIKRITRAVPKAGRLHVAAASKKPIARSAPVFLTDRREKALQERIAALEEKLADAARGRLPAAGFRFRPPAGRSARIKAVELTVYRRMPGAAARGTFGLWLSEHALRQVSANTGSRTWWWLPPVIWPENEGAMIRLVQQAVQRGARRFVLNQPWQIGLFEKSADLDLWAGPFCNLANAAAIECARSLGFAGVIVSPELGREDYLQLPAESRLPLGIVLSGNWPLCISRSLTPEVKTRQPFASPRAEQAWVVKHGSDYWVYPGWAMDLQKQMKLLQNAGYKLFVRLVEPVPKTVKLKKRPGLWNWDIALK